MTSTEQEAPAKEQASTTGAYVILEQHKTAGEGNDDWRIRNDHVEAASADAAIRAYTGKKPAAGTFVAIPARSWRPRTIQVETKSVVTLT